MVIRTDLMADTRVNAALMQESLNMAVARNGCKIVSPSL